VEDSLSKIFGIPEQEIREWAHQTSERFGTTNTVVDSQGDREIPLIPFPVFHDF